MVVMSLEEEYEDQATVLYRKYAGKVQGFLISMGCDRGLAEEITDDAFLAARRRWAHVRVLNEPEGYVFKIARNERSKRQKQHDCRAKDLHPSPYDAPRPPVMTWPRSWLTASSCWRRCASCLPVSAKQSSCGLSRAFPKPRLHRRWVSAWAR